ncbi:hypothetical protein PUN4_50145 [Paraburkholderia unamae]|nr:hypothetical protein PUN4_50145 [Paraburkholderia unamae]
MHQAMGKSAHIDCMNQWLPEAFGESSLFASRHIAVLIFSAARAFDP